MFQHFIIVPFSFRRPNFVKGKFPDPLKPSVLKERFRIFEIITLASLKAQINQDFTLIIIVDPLLPDFYRKKFLEVTSGMKKVILHDFSEIFKQNTITWLHPYVSKETRYLIQTKLDADDALYKGFTKYVQDHFNGILKLEKPPPIHFISGMDVVQWDFIHTPKAPFGYLKPWTRKNTITISSGLTYCCKYPEMDISVMGNNHQIIGEIFRDKMENSKISADLKKQIEIFSNKIESLATNHFPEWDGVLRKETHFHVINTDRPQAMVLNFFSNDQFERIFEHPKLRTIVSDVTIFSEIVIDFQAMTSVIKKYRKSMRVLLYLIWRQLFLDINKQNIKHESLRNKIRYKIKRVKMILDGYKKLA
jgi:hypothetical protein